MRYALQYAEQFPGKPKVWVTIRRHATFDAALENYRLEIGLGDVSEAHARYSLKTDSCTRIVALVV